MTVNHLIPADEYAIDALRLGLDGTKRRLCDCRMDWLVGIRPEKNAKQFG
jgi:hypothetical protein